MPEPGKQVVKSRTESQSDVAESKAARAFQAEQTERTFAHQLLQRLKECKGEVRLRNFQEEWLPTEGGLVHEISVELQPAEGV